MERRVFLGLAAWTAGISALHGYLNVDWNVLRNHLRSRDRLQTLVDRYPLYSGADETLYLLGQTYEAEMAMIRSNPKVAEGPKAKMIEEFEKGASGGEPL